MIYDKPGAPLEARVDDLFARMTSDEKLNMLAIGAHITGIKAEGLGVPRLGVRPLRPSDAPQGVRAGKSTYFPMGVVMASTWDPALIEHVGAAIGEEANALGRQLIFGPCINLQRTPQNGRFFENMSEDPFVTAQIACAYIDGMQSQDVAACPKHFFANDQETGRQSTSSDMDERAMHEMDLYPFEQALTRAHAWSMMVSFNSINGTRSVEDKPFLTDLVRNTWHWDGILVSDWGGIHDTAASMNAGMDLEAPRPNHYTPEAIDAALAAGTISQQSVDAAVKDVLRAIIRTGLADNPAPVHSTVVDGPDKRALALKVADEGIILLKNDGNILPLDRRKIKSIAVIGPNAQDTQLGGRSSADTSFFYQTNVADGIRAICGTGIDVEFAQGCERIKPTADTPAMIAAAAALAAKSDVAIVVVGTDKTYLGEGADPPNLELPGSQDALIQAVVAANPRTIVVLNNGMPLLMDHWVAQVPGLVEAWYAGQEQGNAIAAILFGDVNPSGKLACTIAQRREDYSDWPNYPGTAGHVNFAEGIYYGYRHFDKANIAPLFPFGFGLSYTTFRYGRLSVPRKLKAGGEAVVKINVKNTGRAAGDEIVELYVRDLHPRVDKPVRELKGFQRVSLQPGQEETVAIPIDDSSFQYWDVVHHGWHYDPGDYAIDIGASSRDIRQSATVHVQ